MPTVRLESADDTLELDHVERADYGAQALKGATGLGLPPVVGQWAQGAGNGSRYLGGRAEARDIDLPIYIAGRNRNEMVDYVDRLAMILNAEDGFRLVWSITPDDEWYVDARLVGGGGYVYGEDTVGEDDLQTVITIRSGDPYWTASKARAVPITTPGGSDSTGLLTSSLATFKLAASQASGNPLIDNSESHVPVPVTWTVTAPGSNFHAVSPKGESLWWQDEMSNGDVLTFEDGMVFDQEGNNRYDGLADAPIFWKLPKGVSRITASLADTGEGSSILLSWRPKRLLVI